MQQGTFGTENIKLVLKPVLSGIANAFAIDADNNNNVSLVEMLSYITMTGLSIVPVASQLDEFADEAKDLDRHELQDVLDWVEVDFPDIARNPRAKELIVGTIRMVKENVRYYNLLKG